MAEIVLSNGKIALIDDTDLVMVGLHKWQEVKARGKTAGAKCAIRSGGETRFISMHRMIMSPPPSMVVDHINGNALDNRRSNLRICTKQQNCFNRKEKNKNGKSKYKGVHKDKRYNSWVALIGVNRKQIYLGSFRTQEDAARAYNTAAAKHHGEYASINEIHGGVPSQL